MLLKTTGGSGQLQLNKLSKFQFFFLQDEDDDQLCVDYVMSYTTIRFNSILEFLDFREVFAQKKKE